MLADGRMRAQASGVRWPSVGLLIALKEGSFVRVQEYYDHAKALEAAGLSE